MNIPRNSNGSRIMIFLLIIIALVLVFLVLALPYLSGVTKYEFDKKQKSDRKPKEHTSKPFHEYQAYTPPDEAFMSEQEKRDRLEALKEKASALKEKANVTSSDIPFKIRLQDGENMLRKRKTEKLDFNPDPNEYDYDIDELIREEGEKAAAVASDRTFQASTPGQAKDLV